MLKWLFGYCKFFTPSECDFHSRKCSFHSSFDLSGLAQSTPQHDKQITVIRLHSSGTFCMHANLACECRRISGCHLAPPKTLFSAEPSDSRKYVCVCRLTLTLRKFLLPLAFIGKTLKKCKT